MPRSHLLELRIVFFELPVMTLKIRGVFSREAVMDTLCVAYTSKAKLQ